MSQHPKLNQYTIRKEIAALIDSIKQHSDDIGNNRHVPQIELELILHKIKMLYEKSIIFNHLHMVEDDSQPFESLARELAEATAQVVSPPAPEKKAEPVLVPDPPKAETVIPDPPKTETVIPDPPKTETVIPDPPPVAEISKPEVKTTEQEIPKKEEPVAEEKKKDPEPEVKPEEKKPVTPSSPNPKTRPDIKSFIGLNERIMFVRHLFRNEAASFDEALKQINNCSSISEANSFADMLRKEYSWKSEDEIVTDFFDLIKRRFS